MTMGFQLSPGVQTKEIDLSTSIPAVATSLAATVGRFTWGPADEAYLCTSENDLISVFGQPTNDTYPSFLTSAAFLKYGNSLQVVRVVDDGATNATTGGDSIQIKNDEDFDTKFVTLTQGFYARYPGTYGNEVTVITHSGDATFSDWIYAGAFDVSPDSTNNEIAVAVIVDSLVVEAYLVATVEGSRDTMGNNIFMDEKINKMSKLIRTKASNVTNDGTSAAGRVESLSGGLAVSMGVNAACSDDTYSDQATCETSINAWTAIQAAVCSDSAYTTESVCLANSETWAAAVAGSCSDSAFADEATCIADTNGTWTPETAAGSVGAGEYVNGWNVFANADDIDVNLLIAGGVTNEAISTVTTVSKHMAEVIAEGRKDCMAILSPAMESVVNVGGATNAVNNVIAWRTGDLNIASSYATLDGNYKYTYDKYADTYRWIGFSGDVAGLMANTDAVRDAWWSPAGLNRGIIKSVVKLAYNPSQAHRDQLYKLPNGINPIVSFPGQGTVLWGDRTMLIKPSAFDRINVRRLFIVIEKAIAISAKYFLFEFNNSFTRRNFVNMVEPYLGGLQARQAMYDFYVQCDSSNNTPEVIDGNQFVASMFIKPSKSINFITLNFVATKSGVDFAEVIGQV